MPRRTMREKLVLPSGAVARQIAVEVYPAGEDAVQLAAVYWSEEPETIIGREVLTVSNGGIVEDDDEGWIWEIDLPPSSTLDPSGAVYAVKLNARAVHGSATPRTFEVPDSAGPHWVKDNLVDAPGALLPGGVATAIASEAATRAAAVTAEAATRAAADLALSSTIAGLADVYTPMATVAALPWDGTIRLSHRGGGKWAPENTLEGFRLAANLGGDILELDVDVLLDGSVAVMHDSTVDRTTSGTGALSSFTAMAFKQLTVDAGGSSGWLGENWGTGIRPPLLAEVLAEFANRRVLMIETKSTAVTEPLLDLLDAFGCQNSAIIVNGFTTTLAAQAALVKGRGYPLMWYGSVANVAAAVTADVDYLAIDHTSSDADITTFVATGLPTFAFTVDRRSRWAELQALGVDQVFTDQVHYLHRSTAYATTDQWTTGLPGHGLIVTSGSQPFVNAAGELHQQQGSAQGVMIGHLSPIANPAVFTLTGQAKFVTLPASGQSLQIAFTATDEAYDGTPAGNQFNQNTYMFFLSAGGLLRIYRIPAGGPATQLVTASTAALVADTYVPFTISRTSGGLWTFTRTDTGSSVNVTDTTYTGLGYIHVAKTISNQAKWKGFSVT